MAPRCEIEAMELLGPAGWADPLSYGGGGAPSALLDALPAW